MPSFPKDSSLAQLQQIIDEIYGLPDDRLFSVSDLISNQERFTMRALKGIRKGENKKLKTNLLIALSWLGALANRLHVDLEDAVWDRFPMLCSYCGKIPCACRKIRPAKRVKINRNNSLRPGTLSGFQEMFARIYPPDTRTLTSAGVHLAEEMGELSEAVHHFFGEHKNYIFQEITEEMADYISCVFGVASSAGIDIAKELGKMYSNNCHICHKAPCVCNFTFVAKFKS